MFGEAKSFRGETSEEKRGNRDAFQSDDVERMKKLALRFPGSILVFSTMKQADELSRDEVSRIAKLAEWGREYIRERRQTRAPVIVLTGTELFAPFSLQDAWEKMRGRHAQFIEPGWVRTDNLRVLADLTQQLYLGMPSYGTWLDAKWTKRAARQKARAAQAAATQEESPVSSSARGCAVQASFLRTCERLLRVKKAVECLVSGLIGSSRFLADEAFRSIEVTYWFFCALRSQADYFAN